jgi:hypothetical protein
MHAAVITRDWSLTTPHDLDAERVAAAFGPPVSCLDLADRVVPAARDLVQARSRRNGFPLRQLRGGRWAVRDHRPGCCRNVYYDPAEAASHARSATHMARRYGTSAQLAEEIAESVIAAHGTAMFEPDLRAAGRWVEPPSGLVELWLLGITPGTVQRIWREGLRRPATVRYYLGVVARKPRLEWIRTTADICPDDLELPAHLAWNETAADRADPTARASWLRIGAPRAVSALLSEAGITPAQVREFASAVRSTPSSAAVQLGAWTRAVGAAPSIDALVQLYAAGLPAGYLPSAGAAGRLAEQLRDTGIILDTHDVAMLLAAAGSVPGALAWARAGVCSPVLVAKEAAAGGRPPEGPDEEGISP